MKKSLWATIPIVFALMAIPANIINQITFQEYAELPGGFIAWGDYDSDGDLDLITGCTEGFVAHIIQNHPTGFFQEVQTLPCGNNIHGNSQPWADYDLDGDLDLALPARERSYIYRNDGGTFIEDTRNSLPVQCSGGAWFQWGEIDGIHGLDLVIVGVNESGVFLNDGEGRLTMSQSLPTRDNHSGDLGDFDHDGDLDLVVVGAVPGGGTSQSRFHFEIYQNSGGSLELYRDLGNQAGDVHWVDYNSDGWLDIFIAGGTGFTSHAELWEQNPAGSFNLDMAQPALDAFAALGPPALNEGISAWGDYDGDGDPDLFLGGPVASGCFNRTFINETGGRIVEDLASGLDKTEECYLYPTFTDFDSDGDLDISFWERNGSVWLFINSGASSELPSETQSIPVTPTGVPSWVWLIGLALCIVLGVVMAGVVIAILLTRRKK